MGQQNNSNRSKCFLLGQERGWNGNDQLKTSLGANKLKKYPMRFKMLELYW